MPGALKSPRPKPRGNYLARHSLLLDLQGLGNPPNRTMYPSDTLSRCRSDIRDLLKATNVWREMFVLQVHKSSRRLRRFPRRISRTRSETLAMSQPCQHFFPTDTTLARTSRISARAEEMS
jgi:hypothetical protein